MRRSILSTLKLATRAILLALLIAVFIVGLAPTVLWINAETSNSIAFLKTAYCGMYDADSRAFSTLCTLGGDDDILRFISSHSIPTLLSKLLTTPHKLRLPEAECSSEAKDAQYSKCKAAFTIDNRLAILTAPSTWLPSRFSVIVWSQAFLSSSAIVFWTSHQLRKLDRGAKAKATAETPSKNHLP